MIEKVLNRKNLYKAYRKVVRNKGSAGVDGMEATELFSYLENNRDRIVTSILNHTYVPQPIMGRTKRELRARLWGAYPRVTEKLDYLECPRQWKGGSNRR